MNKNFILPELSEKEKDFVFYDFLSDLFTWMWIFTFVFCLYFWFQELNSKLLEFDNRRLYLYISSFIFLFIWKLFEWITKN